MKIVFQSAIHLFMTCLLGAVVSTCPALADYSTPGFGMDWTLDNLVASSGGAVTGGAGVYEVHDSVIISLTDRVTIDPGTLLTFIDTTGLIGIQVNGSLIALGTELMPIVFTGSSAIPGCWRGLDFNDVNATSEFHLAHCEIAYADVAVDAYDADVWLEYCEIHHGLDKALALSAAAGTITGCHFHDNQQRTVSLTLTASPTIEDCLLENNNVENSSPYPYFNIGLQGVNSPTIRGNTVYGNGNHMSGGIAIWNASNALIEQNWIEGCGYGILCYQTGASPTILNNDLLYNSIHPDQVNWGFGVACNGSNAPILMENRISGHWYGVAAINGGQPNLGDLVNDFPGDDGYNFIYNNSLDGQIYGFYNNTPLPQMAQGNWWGGYGEWIVENAIFHQVDDPALGLVNFEFYLEIADVPGETPAATVLESVTSHPNPFNPQTCINVTLSRESHTLVTVVDLAGRMLRELHAGFLSAGPHALTWDGADSHGQVLPSGVYFFRVVAGAESQSGKLTLVR